MTARTTVLILSLTIALLAGLSLTGQAGAQVNTCAVCHATMQSGFSSAHPFAASDCTICHAGDASAYTEDQAHADLIAFPGDLDNAERVCGQCHADRVASVTHSLMHTGRGMVHTTRLIIDGETGPADTVNLQSLSDTVADSMLRKQCASCHLGQPKTSHSLDVTHDRGGGCGACHINEYPTDAHPALSKDVSDGRCFGCHSRSGRISLSYTGLAEVDESPSRLADGRPVERRPADVHYAAGMQCKDCHTADDVMSSPADAVHQRDAVAAACTNCHEPHDDEAHERLTCNACHAQWAPQCYGCHMEYSEDGEQWDHVERRMTPGRWTDERWAVRNDLPPLGVNAANQVDVFVPGMIMTVAHPTFEQDRFVRRFAPLSPHTTGPSRSCASCHRSSTALGLGQGEFRIADDGIEFEPANELLQDELPADAWTQLDADAQYHGSGHRPLSAVEIDRILRAPLD